jgi:hypothetical protein
MTAEAKTLADELRTIARCIYIAVEKTVADDIAGKATKAADFLDRLSAPVEGVGLTRYMWTPHGLSRDVVGPPETHWVRYEDAAAAIERVKASGRTLISIGAEAAIEASDSAEAWKARAETAEAALAAARAVPADVKLADLIAALENGTQADEDGVMVTVSRQACHEAAKILKARQRKVLPDPLQPKCQHCNDTGLVAINATTGIYARPGPVPDDARGYAEAPCWECNVYPGGFDGPTGAE